MNDSELNEIKASVPRMWSLSHGHSFGGKVSPTYASWMAMLARCRNPKNPKYPRYGGRGIGVTDEWLKFENFLSDMGERPEGTTLDRTDGEQGYCKSNCRWATILTQARNRYTTKLTYDIALDIARRKLRGERGIDLAKEYGVVPSLPSKIHCGWIWRDAYLEARRELSHTDCGSKP